MNFFDGLETSAANIIMRFQEERNLGKHSDKGVRLSISEKQSIKEFWKPYCNVSPKWALYYSSKNGVFDPRYIPNTLYYTKIDQHFNSRKLGYGFNDKNYYSKIFNDITQPETVLRKINGLIYDGSYNLFSTEQGMRLAQGKGELICKPSQESGTGRGIFFIKENDEGMLKEVLENKQYDDYVIQKLVIQHPELDKVHKGPINCIRICSLLMHDSVHILSSVLKMGVGSSKVDNSTVGDNVHFGGMTCGIKSDGRLKQYAYGYYTGKKFDRHPDGVIFDEFEVPEYEKAVELVKKAHPRIAHFRLTGWDIAIDINGEPILIEANMRKGGINFHQFNNGPLFGNLTDKVLNEVFNKE
jgi:hypothetical protein